MVTLLNIFDSCVPILCTIKMITGAKKQITSGYPTSDKLLIEQLINLFFTVMCTLCLFNVPIFCQVHIKWRLMTFEAPNISQVLLGNCLWTCHVNKGVISVQNEDVRYRPELRRPSTNDVQVNQVWSIGSTSVSFSSKVDRLVREVRGSLKRPFDFRPSLDRKIDEFRKLQSGKCVAINEMWEKTW